MKREDLLRRALETGALLEGHFLLSSGLHSSHYFQCARLLERPSVALELGSALADLLPADLRGRIQLTIAPALGGILVAHEVARALEVRAVFAERDPGTGELTLRRGFTLQAGEGAWVLEDVVTTGRSLRETMRVVRAHGGCVIATGALVQRSPQPERSASLPDHAQRVAEREVVGVGPHDTERSPQPAARRSEPASGGEGPSEAGPTEDVTSEGVPFFTLAQLDFPTYAPDDCPLCRAGSVPIKPGSRPVLHR